MVEICNKLTIIYFIPKAQNSTIGDGCSYTLIGIKEDRYM
jgi:hypothetical protein